MSRFGFVGPTYRSQSLNADCQTTMNLYVEAIESQVGKGPMAMYATPGKNLVYNLGGAPMRGIKTLRARTFSVAGTALWELLAGGGQTQRNGSTPIASDGLPVSIAIGGTQILISSEQRAWVYDINANTIVEVTATIGGPVGQVAYFSGFFVAIMFGQNKLQASAAGDATTWPGTSAAGVQNFSELPSALFVDHEQLWVFSPKGIQPYYSSGNFPFPFDTIQGGYIENGLGAPAAICKADNSIFWLDASERGQAMVRRANGFTPVRVSNHAVEHEIQSYGTISDCVMYSEQRDGHENVVVNFPTAQKTWVYDTANGMWTERGYWNTQNGTFQMDRALFHDFNFGMHLVGDPTTGLVYQSALPTLVNGSWQFVTDNGNPIRRLRRAPHISVENQFSTHWYLWLDCETGLGPNILDSGPTTTLYLNDSTGQTWAVQVNDLGVLVTALPIGGLPSPQLLYFNDSAGDGTSWQIIITPLGVLQAVPVTANTGYLQALQMISISGKTIWNLFVTDVGGGHAVIKTQKTGNFVRGPQISLSWSNDFAHTWSNEHLKSLGRIGDYKKRVIWRQLGTTRDRVYQVLFSDPAPLRIVDAYLDADPGYKPSERMTKELVKRA
jgi:hypothetical protein